MTATLANALSLGGKGSRPDPMTLIRTLQDETALATQLVPVARRDFHELIGIQV